MNWSLMESNVKRLKPSTWLDTVLYVNLPVLTCIYLYLPVACSMSSALPWLGSSRMFHIRSATLSTRVQHWSSSKNDATWCRWQNSITHSRRNVVAWRSGYSLVENRPFITLFYWTHRRIVFLKQCLYLHIGKSLPSINCWRRNDLKRGL